MGGVTVDRVAAFDWRRALRLAAQLGLATWFAYWSWQTIGFYFDNFPYHMDMLGFDCRLYLHAAQTWLAGGDPWATYALQHSWASGAPDLRFYFTGPPPTVLAFVPFAWLSDGVFTVGWMTLTVAAAFYTLQRLHLPAWWVLFPPMAQSVFVGNPHVVCLALILSGSSLLRALAPAAKAYAVLPMIGERQWRALAVFALAAALSVVILWPLWARYTTDYAQIQAWIISATWGGFSATRDPWLFVVVAAAIGALALIDLRAASWLAVPALWPAAEYFYATFALPVMTPLLAVLLAVPIKQLPPIAIVLYVLWRFAGPPVQTHLTAWAADWRARAGIVGDQIP